MKKKGFTLVELLAVIAILAILVIIALPNVLKMFRNAKQNTFVTEVQNLVRSAEDKYLTSSMLNGNNTCFDSSSNPLDMTGRDNIIYKIKLSDTGKLIEVSVADDNYELIVKEETGINRADIGSKYKVNVISEDTAIVGCDNTALKGEYVDKKLIIKKDNEEIRTIQMEKNTTTTIDKESGLSLITCNNGIEVSEENDKIKLNNVLVNNSVCTFSNSLNNVVDNIDDTQNNILLLNDLNLDKQIIVNTEKLVTIDMNGKSINSSFNDTAILNNSNLTIKNSSESESLITSNGVIIDNRELAELNIEKVKIISNDTNNLGAIANHGKLVVKNSHIEGSYGITHDTQTATFDIYDSEINGTIIDGIYLNENSASSGNIYNSTIKGKKIAITSNSTGTINIYSGTIIGETERGIANYSTGTINLIQTDKPIYVSYLSTSWGPAIFNNSTGIINIRGVVANKCTSIQSDTTSGICIYAENENSGGIQNVIGTININGAYIYGGTQGINNHSTGTINVSNVKSESNGIGIINYGDGTINICSGEISGGIYDLRNASTGTINYTSKVTLKNSTTNGTNINLTDAITCN